MKINIFGIPHQNGAADVNTRNWCLNVQDGFLAHGLTDVHIKQYPAPVDPDCALSVHWGPRNITKETKKHHEKTKTDILIIERGFTPNRGMWFMLGFNGLNGLAEYHNKNMPSARWIKHHAHRMQSWYPVGKYVLILGQRQNDAALYGYDINKWAKEAQRYYKKLGVPYVFRAHPGSKVTFMDTVPGLSKAIDGAFCVVTYNSSAGVESILRGKPTISMHPGSMVWDVTTHTLASYKDEFMPDRGQWACDFAYTQWLASEISSGAAWEHLKQRYENKHENTP